MQKPISEKLSYAPYETCSDIMFPRSGPSNFVLLFADFTKEVQAKLEQGRSRLRRVEEDIERAHERERESHEKGWKRDQHDHRSYS